MSWEEGGINVSSPSLLAFGTLVSTCIRPSVDDDRAAAATAFCLPFLAQKVSYFLIVHANLSVITSHEVDKGLRRL